jgi:hypothetical protein
MYKFISILENDDYFSIWFTIDKIIGNQKMLCYVAYIPPQNSNYSSLDMFDAIENQYLEFEGLAKYFCLLGDFNSRTGRLGDSLDVNKHLADHLLLDEYCYDSDDLHILESCDVPINRTSQDNTVNKHCERFLELCKNLGIFIMNGRMFLDKDVGCNTCDGKSVVDYVVCSPEVFRCCSDFEVIGFDSLLSDKHCQSR